MTENENIEQTQEIIYNEECDKLVEDALFTKLKAILWPE